MSVDTADFLTRLYAERSNLAALKTLADREHWLGVGTRLAEANAALSDAIEVFPKEKLTKDTPPAYGNKV